MRARAHACTRTHGRIAWRTQPDRAPRNAPPKRPRTHAGAHRLGQTREVSVFRLLTQGSLDEHMHSVAVGKLALDAALNTKEAAAPISTEAKSKAPSAATIANLLATALA
jgi:hypothetical protein